MAEKRLQDGSEQQDSKHPEDKRMRRLPSFATVIRQVMMAKTMQNVFMAMEPLLRNIVQEELERILVPITSFNLRSSHLQIQEIEPPSNLHLQFQSSLSHPIYTGKKIESSNGNPLQIVLTHDENGTPLRLPSPLKLELVIVDGHFPPEGCESWTAGEFDKHIVKERDGKRPLLIGELNLTMKDDCRCTVGELIITDNSSWIKSRHFRIGARVLPRSLQGPRITEALTERFMVKDHRGESYQKHYPPSLNDDVWRLDKIGKDGIFHKRLADENIYTVQDFLKLHSVDPKRLRRILGMGMSDRVWEIIVSHARTCDVGQRTYIYRGSNCNLLLNPICQFKAIVVQNDTLTPQQLTKDESDFVLQMVREAYERWDMVEENFDAIGNNIHSMQNVNMSQETISQPWYSQHQQNSLMQFEFEGFTEMEEEAPNNLEQGFHN